VVHIAIPVCWSHRFVWSIPFFPVEITFPDLGFPDLDPYRFSTLRISDLRIWTFTDLGLTDLDLRIWDLQIWIYGSVRLPVNEKHVGLICPKHIEAEESVVHYRIFHVSDFPGSGCSLQLVPYDVPLNLGDNTSSLNLAQRPVSIGLFRIPAEIPFVSKWG